MTVILSVGRIGGACLEVKALDINGPWVGIDFPTLLRTKENGEMGKDPKPEKNGGMDILAVQIREDRMKEAIKQYRRKGTMIPFVSTFRDLSEKEKAEFLDDAMTRHKGAAPKRNPFKK